MRYTDLVANAFSEARAWKFATATLAAVCGMLAFGLIYESRNNPVILIPQNFAAENGVMKIQPGQFADTSVDYLGQVALGDVALILNWRPETVVTQYQRFLNRATNDLYAKEQVRLTAEAAEHKSTATSQSFYPDSARVNPSRSSVEVEGTLIRWMNDKETVRSRIKIVVTYKIYKGYYHVADIELQK